MLLEFLAVTLASFAVTFFLLKAFDNDNQDQ